MKIKYILNYKNYEINKDNIIYNIKIIKEYNFVLIKSENYSKKVEIDILSNKIGINFNSIREIYDYLINILKKNNVSIKKVLENDSIILLLKTNKQNFELILKFNKKDDFYKNRITLIDDSYIDYVLDNTFTTFNSMNNIFYLIYSTEFKSIICYDIVNQKKINEIKKAHKKHITNFRHCLDNNNKRDLVMSISCDDNNIKIWNINNFECILNINNFNSIGKLYSSCFLKEKNDIFIITSNYNYLYYENNCDLIKVLNLKGEKIKEINESNENIFYIDIYYDNKNLKKYILTGNEGYIKAYDYDNNKLFYKYNDNMNYEIRSIIINEKKEMTKLINSGKSGFIKIWNFHTGMLLYTIDSHISETLGMCLMNNNNIIIGCNNCYIILINSEYNITYSLGHRNCTSTVKKIIHPLFGECLISQGNDGKINLSK